jgi:hypothetical protein
VTSTFVIKLGIGLAIALLGASALQRSLAADALRLKEGISFVQDADNGFPIVAENFDDDTIESGKPAFIFFGAAGDMNTNRQAKRVIDLYNSYRKQEVKFILVDVDHPSSKGGAALVKKFYRGYVPCEVIIDRKGNEHLNQIGEVESQVLRKRLEQVL